MRQTEVLKVRVTSDLRRRVETKAKDSGLQMSAFIRLAVDAALTKNGNVDSAKKCDTAIQSTN